MNRSTLAAWAVVALGVAAVGSEVPYSSPTEFANYAMKLREGALLRVEPQVLVPSSGRPMFGGGRYPWKNNIVTTVFWVGELPTQNNPVPNTKSSWDVNWMGNFGGYDNPDTSRRRGYIPANFVPRLNPFYVALPYNDVERGRHKPEASRVIPWFRREFEAPGRSVCKDRWVAIRKGRRICYAQWSDCGPFRTDHWQYVFGNERPKPNLNKGAGLDVSPAVRDYLGITGMDVTDWRFVEANEVPPGPWRQLGENNHFVQQRRAGGSRVASSRAVPGANAPKVSAPEAGSGGGSARDGAPAVILR
jgi:hypothetical protein